MPSLHRGFAAVLIALSFALPCKARTGNIPGVRPSNPVGTEMISLGTDGICGGFGHHNSNGGYHTVFGLSGDGLTVQRPPYDMMKQWTSTAACGEPDGWSGEVGEQYGAHVAQDAADPFFGTGYRVQLGAMDLQIEAGAFYEKFNRKRLHMPQTINGFGFFPFVSIQLKGKF